VFVVWVNSVEGGGSEFEQFQTCEGHTNFVSCVHVIPPTEKHPDGLVLSGSHDHTILAFELGKHQPVFRLAGHKGTGELRR
jgi:phospholipase A-2-activating protein